MYIVGTHRNRYKLQSHRPHVTPEEIICVRAFHQNFSLVQKQEGLVTSHRPCGHYSLCANCTNYLYIRVCMCVFV